MKSLRAFFNKQAMRHAFIDGGEYSYLIVTNFAAGVKKRYTIYRIPLNGNGRVKIVGRELPFGFSKKYIKRLIACNHSYKKYLKTYVKDL